jgi:uncharacterized membrane protein YphA (DoxX/SURF4 family)
VAIARTDKHSPAERQVRTLLATGATGVALGVAVAVGGAAGVGSVVTVGSLILLIYSVHRFGRVGPDARPAGRRRQ